MMQHETLRKHYNFLRHPNGYPDYQDVLKKTVYVISPKSIEAIYQELCDHPEKTSIAVSSTIEVNDRIIAPILQFPGRFECIQISGLQLSLPAAISFCHFIGTCTNLRTLFLGIRWEWGFPFPLLAEMIMRLPMILQCCVQFYIPSRGQPPSPEALHQLNMFYKRLMDHPRLIRMQHFPLFDGGDGGYSDWAMKFNRMKDGKPISIL